MKNIYEYVAGLVRWSVAALISLIVAMPTFASIGASIPVA